MQLSSSWKTASLAHVISAVKSRMRQVAWRGLAPFGVSPQQCQLLLAMAERDGRCHGDLAQCTWMDKPTTTRILRTLQDRGLVRCAADPTHRRRTLYTLEPEGMVLAHTLQGFRQNMREGMEAGLTVEECARARAFLASVMDNLDRMEAAFGEPAASK